MRIKHLLRWGAATVVVGGVAVTLAVSAQEPVAASHCSERTLRGSYGGLASGSRVIPFGPHAGKTEAVISTGLRIYDGNGGFTESGADLHGQLTGVTLDPGGISGTYTVNEDCTGVSTRWVPGLPFSIVSNFVIVDNAKSVKEAVMAPGPNVITVLLDRK